MQFDSTLSKMLYRIYCKINNLPFPILLLVVNFLCTFCFVQNATAQRRIINWGDLDCDQSYVFYRNVYPKLITNDELPPHINAFFSQRAKLNSIKSQTVSSGIFFHEFNLSGEEFPSNPFRYKQSYEKFNRRGFITKLLIKYYSEPKDSVERKNTPPSKVVYEHYKYTKNNTILVKIEVRDVMLNTKSVSNRKFHYDERNAIDTMCFIGKDGSDSEKVAFKIDTIQNNIVVKSQKYGQPLRTFSIKIGVDSIDFYQSKTFVDIEYLLKQYFAQFGCGSAISYEDAMHKYRRFLFQNEPFKFLVFNSSLNVPQYDIVLFDSNNFISVYRYIAYTKEQEGCFVLIHSNWSSKSDSNKVELVDIYKRDIDDTYRLVKKVTRIGNSYNHLNTVDDDKTNCIYNKIRHYKYGF